MGCAQVWQSAASCMLYSGVTLKTGFPNLSRCLAHAQKAANISAKVRLNDQSYILGCSDRGVGWVNAAQRPTRWLGNRDHWSTRWNSGATPTTDKEAEEHNRRSILC